MANSNYLRNLILQRTFLDPAALPGLWVSLHTDDPGDSGAGEVRDYERQQVGFQAAEPGAVSNRTGLQYDNLPSCTVSHFGIWDSERRGNYLTGGPLDFGLIVPKGKSLRWAEGQLVLRIP